MKYPPSMILASSLIVLAHAPFGQAQGLNASIEEEEKVERAIEEPTSFQVYRVSNETVSASSSTQFKAGERVVICITPPKSGFVSVWDVPPNGSRERLYPNAHSHPDGQKGARVEAGARTCIGEVGSGYKVTITRSEGIGSGQFYLVLTDRLETHPNEDSFRVKEWRRALSASIEDEGTLMEQRKGYADTFFVYSVTE